MTKVLQDALKKQKKSTKRELLQIAGTLGIPLDGAKLVEVPNRKPYVYVKLRDNQNEVIQAYNNKVAASYGLPVILEYQGNRYVVQSVDTLRYQSDWTSFSPFLPRHGNTHSFDPVTNGGADIVWVHSKQFMPSLIIPSGTAGGPDVVMSSYTLKNTDGSFKYVGNTGTPNLTPYKPVTGTQAVMVLVYLDTVSGNPYLMVGSGSYFAATITGTAGVLPYVPLDTNISHIPLAAVRMVTGTNAIGWSNIYDLRQFYYNLTGSSGEGGTVAIQDEGVGLGNADTLNFVGDPVSVTLAGGTARIFITGSAGGVSNLTGSSIGLPNKVALTNSSGFLTTDPSLAWGLSSGKGFIEFGANVAGKVFNAGYVGYQLFDNDFDIIGAGTGSGDRWVRVYDNIRANLMQPTTLQVIGVTNRSTWPYLDASGTAVPPINAPIVTAITGSDYVLGVGGITPTSFITPVSSLNAYFNHTLTPSDGWIPVDDAWTRTGNLTFTVPGNVTAIYRKGAKIRYKDGGAYEYGVIASSVFGSVTTVTLIDNTNYAMAATTITDRYISYIENPEGFPHWFDWNANPQGFGAGQQPTDVTYQWMAVGATIYIAYIELTNGTSNATTFTATAPVAAQHSVTSVGGTLVNNGGLLTTAGRITMGAGSTTVIFRTDMASGGWAAANGKRAVATWFYEF